jgi:5-methyltetrahydropteroyltriglutamate--homocysteine methyltransferase
MSPTPPFRAENIGSLLRPQGLKIAFRDIQQSKIDAATFQMILDRCILDAIKMQEDVGLQCITDGEFRRGSWFFGFVQAVEGLTTRDSLFDFQDADGGHSTFQTAYVKDKLCRTRGITTDEFSYVLANTARTPKITMPAPSLVHFFRANDAVSPAAYPRADDVWPDLIAVYREELAALGRLGCTYVQLDEVPCAMLCDPKVRAGVTAMGLDPVALVDRYIAAVNDAVAERPAGMTIGLHLCRGNYKGQWMAQGGYEDVARELFMRTNVDVFFLEYDTPRAGGFEPLRHMPAGKTVILGLISSKTPLLEPLDDLRRRVDEASRYVPLDRLGVSTQCGFASSVGGNPLSIDDERRKLARVVELARAIWGET